jgi:hypothetical protein
LAGLTGLLAVLVALAPPSPPPARANIACDAIGGAGNAITGGVEAISGGLVGAGNPVSDACDQVTGKAVGVITSPVSDALKGVGNGIFDQITTWVSEGATWLIGQVVTEVEKTTTPDLTAKGFLAEYAQMAQIAAVLAAAMLLLAILEAVAQSSWELLARAVLIHLPVAFIATSVAFAVVQLLLVATDSMCHAIAVATHDHSQHFFKSAITSLGKAGGSVGGAPDHADPVGQTISGTAGATAPLFVTFLVAIIGAFAAGAVWIELLMRDASIYVVVLFLPFSFSAWIWPRWAAALRRTGEVLVVIISSKFLTVSIIALAAGIAAENNGGIEPILAASALMLLACFAPFLLFKFVPFAEGAMGAAYGRRSAAGGAVSGLQLASEVQILRNMARSNWSASPPEVWNVGSKGSGPSGGGGAGNPPGGRPGGGQPGGNDSAGAAKSGAASTGKVPVAGGASAAGATSAASPAGAAAASPATAALAAPGAVGQSAQSGARRLEQSGVAKAASEGSSQPTGATSDKPSPAAGSPSGGEGSTESPKPTAASPGETPPRPPQELNTKSGPKGAK